MGVKVKQTDEITGASAHIGENKGPEFVEVAFENRVTYHDGQAFHWAKNQVRNFADDGVGLGHVASSTASTVRQEIQAFGDSRS